MTYLKLMVATDHFTCIECAVILKLLCYIVKWFSFTIRVWCFRCT